MTTIARTALLIAWAIGGAACFSAGEPSASTAQAVVGGDADTEHAAVVALVRASNGAVCSGTLVAPQIVITAAHCVYGVDAADLRVVVGAVVAAPEQTAAVKSAVTYPTYTGAPGDLLGGIDLAAVYLAQPLAAPPVAIAGAIDDATLASTALTVVGYGADDGATSSGAGVRRAVVLSVDEVCARFVRMGGADANACSGDSGGAALVAGRLFAVVSSGMAGCFAPTRFTRLDAHSAWLGLVLSGDASAPCPACVTPDPSCGAPLESPPTSDAASDATDPAGAPVSAAGGCAVEPRARDVANAALLLGALAAAIARRQTRVRRGIHSS